MPSPISPASAARKQARACHNQRYAEKYEIGAVESDQFARHAVELFELDVSPEAFKNLWNSWVHPPYAGTEKTLQTLGQNYRLACLSNTNALHWDYLHGLMDIQACFHQAFASHLIARAKPDPESFLIPMREMNAGPAEIWFFDDTEMNINAARDLGITAYHVDRKVGVIPTLKSLDLV